MIQRIQSLWLFIAAILAVLTFKFPFYVGTWMQNNVQHPQTALLAYTPSVLVLVTTVVVIVLSLIAIFMYKNRKQQLWVTILDLIISVALIYFYYHEIQVRFLNGGGTVSIYSIFVFAIPVLLILAIRGINRDMKLLKSADRLRN